MLTLDLFSSTTSMKSLLTEEGALPHGLHDNSRSEEVTGAPDLLCHRAAHEHTKKKRIGSFTPNSTTQQLAPLTRSIKTRKESNTFDQDQKWLALWEASNEKMFCK